MQGGDADAVGLRTALRNRSTAKVFCGSPLQTAAISPAVEPDTFIHAQPAGIAAHHFAQQGFCRSRGGPALRAYSCPSKAAK